MFEFNVKMVQNNKIVDVDLSRYIANKTVLVCTGHKFIQKPSLEYFKYVDSLLDTYNLDEVIVVNSKEDRFFPMVVRSYFPRLTAIIDDGKNYIKLLRHSKGIKSSLERLADKWMFQHLIKDGKEKGFWQQPLSNHWRELMSDKKAVTTIMKKGSYIAKILQKLYKEQHKRDIWSIEHMNYLFLNDDGGSLFHDIGAYLFYFKLINNSDLEQFLAKKP
jgi:hypothetical protein